MFRLLFFHSLHSRARTQGRRKGEITTNAPGNVERGTSAAKLAPDDETTPHHSPQRERESGVQLKRARARAACQGQLDGASGPPHAHAHATPTSEELRGAEEEEARPSVRPPVRPSLCRRGRPGGRRPPPPPSPSPSPPRERRSQRSLHALYYPLSVLLSRVLRRRVRPAARLGCASSSPPLTPCRNGACAAGGAPPSTGSTQRAARTAGPSVSSTLSSMSQTPTVHDVYLSSRFAPRPLYTMCLCLSASSSSFCELRPA